MIFHQRLKNRFRKNIAFESLVLYAEKEGNQAPSAHTMCRLRDFKLHTGIDCKVQISSFERAGRPAILN